VEAGLSNVMMTLPDSRRSPDTVPSEDFAPTSPGSATDSMKTA
jgi:hypothetical protein